MKFVSSIKALTLGAAIATVTAATSFAAEFEFKLHHFISPKSPAHHKMLVPWAESIMEASNGRIKIEVFPSMSLGGKPPQLPQQARDGVVDMAWIVNAYAAGLFPRTEVFELPGVYQGNIEAVNLAMRDMYTEFLAEDFKGLEPLFMHVHGGQAIHMAEEIVRSPADMVGKKIRIPSRTGAWVLEALGASPTKTSVGEIPVALSKKVVDGALIPFEIIPPLKIHEQTKYQIEGPGGKRLGTTSFSLLMNGARWDGLPDDIKAIFKEKSGPEFLKETAAVWAGGESFGIKIATDSGNEHIQLSDEEWAKFEEAISTVPQRWVDEMNSKGIDGQAILDKAHELIAKNTMSQ